MKDKVVTYLFLLLCLIPMLSGQGWAKGGLFDQKVRQQTVSNDMWAVQVVDCFKTSDQIIGKYGFTLQISGPANYEISLKDAHPDIHRMILQDSRLLIVGRKKNFYMTVINLDERNVVDRFVVDEPLFSSDERYMAFHLPKSRTSSRRAGPIFLYDLGRDPQENRIGLAKANFNTNNVKFWQVDVGLMLWPEYNLKNQVAGATQSTPEIRLGFSKWADNTPIFVLIGTDQKTGRDWIGLVDLRQGLENARVKSVDFARGEFIAKNSRFDRAEARDIIFHNFGRVTIKSSELVNNAQSVSIDLNNPEKDLQAPEMELELKGNSEIEGNTYFGPAGEIELTARDMGINPGGIERVEYSIDGEEKTVSDSRVLIKTDRLSEGVHELHGRAVDRAGNTSGAETLKFTVDRAPPATIHSVKYIDEEKNLIYQDEEIKLSGEDEETSLQKIEIRYKEFPWVTYDPDKPLIGLQQGTHYIRYRGVDRALNREKAHRLDFKVIDIPADSFSLPVTSASRYGPARYSFRDLRKVTEGKFLYNQLKLKIKGQTFTTADEGMDFSLGNLRQGKTYPYELSVWPEKLMGIEEDVNLECKLIVPVKFNDNDEVLELEFNWPIHYSQPRILINEVNPWLDRVEIFAAGYLDMSKISFAGKLSGGDSIALTGPVLSSDSKVYRTITTDLKSTDDRLIVYYAGQPVDAVVWSNKDGEMPEYALRYNQKLVQRGLWTDTFVNTQDQQAAVRGPSSGMFSIGRAPGAKDTDSPEDWLTMRATFGRGNMPPKFSEGDVLINEVGLADPRRGGWVELLVNKDNIDLQSLLLTDLDGEDGYLVDRPLTAGQGDLVVIHESEGITETDMRGDVNGNGIIDIYLGEKIGFNYTSDQLVLKEADTLLDALALSEPGEEISEPEAQDMRLLVNFGQWKIEGMTYRQSDGLTAPPSGRYSLGRTGSDSNNKEDWRLFVRPTVGKENVPANIPAAGEVLINEVRPNFEYEVDRDWAELYNKSNRSVNIGPLVLTDFDGSDQQLSPDADKITLHAGEYAVVHWGEGTTETDEKGDLNGNGNLDIYVDDQQLFKTDDQLALVAGEQVLDGVVWSDRKGTMSEHELKDARRMTRSGNWRDLFPDVSDRSGAVYLKPRNVPLSRIPNGADSNRKVDWVSAVPTPGAKNRSGVEDNSPPVSQLITYGPAVYRGKMVIGNLETMYSVKSYDSETLVSRQYMSVDGAGFSLLNRPVSFDFPGTHVLEFYARDFAGNTETKRRRNVLVDLTPPQVGVEMEKNSLTAFGTDIAGIRDIYVEVDGGGFTRFDKPVELEPGEHQVGYYAFDGVGNRSQIEKTTVISDLTPPEITAISLSDTVFNNMMDEEVVISFLTDDNYPRRSGWLKVRIYDNQGLKVATIVDGERSFGLQELTWKGRNNKGELLEAGNYRIEAIVYDGAGNRKSTSTGVKIIQDVTPPVISYYRTPEANRFGWNNDTVIVSYSAYDTQTGVDSSGSQLGADIIQDEGVNQYVSAFAVDMAGNRAEIEVGPVNIDFTAPNGEHSHSEPIFKSDTLYVGAGSNLKLTGSDTLSGYWQSRFELDLTTSETYTVPLGNLAEGSHEISYYSLDKAYNSEDTRTHEWTVDLTGPQTEMELTEPEASGEGLSYGGAGSELAISAADNLSGVDHLELAVGGDTKTVNSDSYVYALDSLSEDSYLFTASGVDRVENSGPAVSRKIAVDRTAPAINLEVEGENIYEGEELYAGTDVTFSLTATDSGPVRSGLEKFEVFLDGLPVGSELSGITVTSNELTEGEHILTASASDRVDNRSDTFSFAFVVDRTPPEVVVEFDIENDSGTEIIAESLMSLDVEDTSSGVEESYYYLIRPSDSEVYSTYSAPFEAGEEIGYGTGPATASAYAVDRVNNVSEPENRSLIVKRGIRGSKYLSSRPRLLVWDNTDEEVVPPELNGFFVRKLVVDSSDSFFEEIRSDAYNVFMIVGSEEGIGQWKKEELAEYIYMGMGGVLVQPEGAWMIAEDMKTKLFVPNEAEDVREVLMYGEGLMDETLTADEGASVFRGAGEVFGYYQPYTGQEDDGGDDEDEERNRGRGHDSPDDEDEEDDERGRLASDSGAIKLFSYGSGQLVNVGYIASGQNIAALVKKVSGLMGVSVAGGRRVIEIRTSGEVADLGARLKEEIPEGASVISSSPPVDEESGGALSWYYESVVDSPSLFWYEAELRGSDTLTFTSNVDLLVRGLYRDKLTLALDVKTRGDAAVLAGEVLSELQELGGEIGPGYERGMYHRAKAKVTDLVARLNGERSAGDEDESDEDEDLTIREKMIKDAVEAIESLTAIDSVDTTHLRYKLDLIILVL